MKKYIAIALLMVLGTVYPAYARWTVGAAGGGVAAAGGPAPGTVLVGYNTATGLAAKTAAADDTYFTAAGHVATATATAVHAYVRLGGLWDATALKIVVYDASQDLMSTCTLATLAESEVNDCTSWSPSAPSISASSTYYLGVIFNAGTPDVYVDDGTAWGIGVDQASTYTTPSANVDADSAWGEDAMTIWLTN